MPTFFTRRRAAEVFAVTCIAVCLVFLAGPVVLAGLDRNQKCVSNAGRIATALTQYVQDYDELLPQPIGFSSIANFQSIVGPYVGNDPSVYRCPANGNAFYTPNAALGGQFIGSFPYFDEVEIVRDSKPHPDGKLTVSFLDGHVERGGVDPIPTEVLCRKRVGQIATALFQYTQDYDEILPYQKNDDDFRQALEPYMRTRSAWRCPDTDQYFALLSPENRGKSFYSFPDTAPIVAIQDPIPHQNGIVTTVYLDGYLEQRGPNGNIIYPSPASGPDTSLRNFKQLGLANLQYSEDYDERLPLYSNYPELFQKLYPYLNRFNSSRSLQGYQQPTYQADPQWSGVATASIAEPANNIILRDVFDFGDGLITAGYLDGHAVRIPPQRPAGWGQGQGSITKGGKGR